jgi:hypothetical protein
MAMMVRRGRLHICRIRDPASVSRVSRLVETERSLPGKKQADPTYKTATCSLLQHKGESSSLCDSRWKREKMQPERVTEGARSAALGM